MLITETNVAKVSDFGFAKIKDEAQSLVSGVAGTLAWMAPESLRGERISSLFLSIFFYAPSKFLLLREAITTKADVYRYCAEK